jgi:hypothetical protein
MVKGPGNSLPSMGQVLAGHTYTGIGESLRAGVRCGALDAVSKLAGYRHRETLSPFLFHATYL